MSDDKESSDAKVDTHASPDRTAMSDDKESSLSSSSDASVDTNNNTHHSAALFTAIPASSVPLPSSTIILTLPTNGSGDCGPWSVCLSALAPYARDEGLESLFYELLEDMIRLIENYPSLHFPEWAQEAEKEIQSLLEKNTIDSPKLHECGGATKLIDLMRQYLAYAQGLSLEEAGSVDQWWSIGGQDEPMINWLNRLIRNMRLRYCLLRLGLPILRDFLGGSNTATQELLEYSNRLIVQHTSEGINNWLKEDDLIVFAAVFNIRLQLFDIDKNDNLTPRDLESIGFPIDQWMTIDTNRAKRNASIYSSPHQQTHYAAARNINDDHWIGILLTPSSSSSTPSAAPLSPISFSKSTSASSSIPQIDDDFNSSSFLSQGLAVRQRRERERLQNEVSSRESYPRHAKTHARKMMLMNATDNVFHQKELTPTKTEMKNRSAIVPLYPSEEFNSMKNDGDERTNTTATTATLNDATTSLSTDTAFNPSSTHHHLPQSSIPSSISTSHAPFPSSTSLLIEQAKNALAELNERFKNTKSSSSSLSTTSSFLSSSKFVKTNQNLMFYSGELKINLKAKAMSIDEIISHGTMTHASLEKIHNYIQWLFPTSQQSSSNKNSQPLNADEIKGIKGLESVFRSRFIAAYAMMLDFFGMRLAASNNGRVDRIDATWKERYSNITNSNRHNCRRITRILTSLGEFGCDRLQAGFMYIIIREIREQELDLRLEAEQYFIPAIVNTALRSYFANLLHASRSSHKRTVSDEEYATNFQTLIDASF
jgi:hypothetical protein